MYSNRTYRIEISVRMTGASNGVEAEDRAQELAEFLRDRANRYGAAQLFYNGARVAPGSARLLNVEEEPQD